jgi:hypothetical protein
VWTESHDSIRSDLESAVDDFTRCSLHRVRADDTLCCRAAAANRARSPTSVKNGPISQVTSNASSTSVPSTKQIPFRSPSKAMFAVPSRPAGHTAAREVRRHRQRHFVALSLEMRRPMSVVGCPPHVCANPPERTYLTPPPENYSLLILSAQSIAFLSRSAYPCFQKNPSDPQQQVG